MLQVEFVDAGLIIAGLLLAFVGAAVSVYAVTLTGFLIGAGAGYVLAPSLVGFVSAEGLIVTAGAVLVGGAVGAFLSYAGLSFAVLGIGAVVGAFIGRFAVGPFYVEGTIFLAGATLAGIAIGALFGFVLTRTTLVLSTAFIGAALATRTLTVADFATASETVSIEPLMFDPSSPLFLAVFVLGALSQLGLFKFGYVTKLVAIIPGARRWTASDNGDKSAS